MFLKKYRLVIVFAFLGIFFSKMLISGAPVFFIHIDKQIMNSVIMQIEAEHSADSEGSKTKLKLCDYKVDFQSYHAPLSVRDLYGLCNSFIDHSKRYVDPFHASVPTPPPNFC